MASITKRGDGYRITVSIGFDGNGKRLRHTETYIPKAKTPKAIEKEVKHYAELLDQKAKEGKISIDGGVVFSEFVDTWSEEWAKDNLTIGQRESYLDHLRLHVIPVIGKMRLSKIKRKDCNEIIARMKADGKAPKTIRRIATAMRSVFEYALYLELINSNPSDRLNLPRLQKDDEIHCFDLEQAQRFLNALTLRYPVKYGGRKRKDSHGNTYSVSEYSTYTEIPYQFQVYFNLAIYGGFRRSELLALTWNDIHYETNTISINKAVSSTKEYGQIVKDTKTTAGRREIQLPQICFEMLQEWEEQQKDFSRLSSWEGQPAKTLKNNFIFIQQNGKGMDLGTPTHKFKEIITMYNAMVEEKANHAESEEERNRILSERLPLIRLHDLRHTSATLLISEGTDILTVSKRLGHSSPSITLDVYSHALKKKDEIASNTLESLFHPHHTEANTDHANKSEMYS